SHRRRHCRKRARSHTRRTWNLEQRHVEFHQHGRGSGRGPGARMSVDQQTAARAGVGVGRPPRQSAARAFVDLARPFTLVAPALGFVSGAATAIGAFPREPWTSTLLIAPAIGSLMAAMLNACNNALNQIY